MEKLIKMILNIKNEEDLQDFDSTEYAIYLAAVMNEGERNTMFAGGINWQAEKEILIDSAIRLCVMIGKCAGIAISEVEAQDLEAIKAGEANFNDFIDFNSILVEVFADDENEYVNLDFYNFVQNEIYKYI